MMAEIQSGDVGLKKLGYGSLNEDSSSATSRSSEGVENNYIPDVFSANKSKVNQGAINTSLTDNTKSLGKSSSNSTDTQGNSSIFNNSSTAKFGVTDGFDLEASQNITKAFTGTMMYIPNYGWANNGVQQLSSNNQSDSTNSNNNTNSNTTLNEDTMSQIKAYVTELFNSFLQSLMGESSDT